MFVAARKLTGQFSFWLKEIGLISVATISYLFPNLNVLMGWPLDMGSKSMAAKVYVRCMLPSAEYHPSVDTYKVKAGLDPRFLKKSQIVVLHWNAILKLFDNDLT